MKLIKGFGLVILAVVAIALVTALIALSPKSGAAAVSVKALPQTRIAGYLMPVREAAAVTVDYSKFTIRELKAMGGKRGIRKKSYAKPVTFFL
jgi:hypothetical protein